MTTRKSFSQDLERDIFVIKDYSRQSHELHVKLGTFVLIITFDKIVGFVLTIIRLYYVFYNSFSIALKRRECLTGGTIL